MTAPTLTARNARSGSVASRHGYCYPLAEDLTMTIIRETTKTGASKKTYEKPAVHSEKMFETSALACGKCTSGPVSQAQCGTLLSNS